MKQVFVRKLTLQSWRQFKDRQSVELPKIGLVGLRGFNRDTGGSSASGKSSVALALAYAFGFCPFPASEQQAWDSKTPLQVEVQLETPLGPVLLKRGKEFSLTYLTDNRTVKGAAKGVEEEIVKLTGLPTDLLEALTYRQQQLRGRFLSATDAERKTFLGLLLGAGELESRIADSKKKIATLESEISAKQQVVETLSGAVKPTEEPELQPTDNAIKRVADAEALLKLHQSEPGIHEALIKTLEKELAQVVVDPPAKPDETKLNQLIAKRDEAKRREQKLRTDEFAEQQKFLDEIMKLQARIAETIKAAAVIPRIQQDIKDSGQKLQKLAGDKCPTCEQGWPSAKQAADAEADRLKKLQEDLAARELTRSEMSTLEEQLKQQDKARHDFVLPTRQQMTDIRIKLDEEVARERQAISEANAVASAQYEVAIQKAREKYVTAIADSRVNMATARRELQHAEDSLRIAKSDLAHIEQMNAREQRRYEDEKASYTTQLQVLMQRQGELIVKQKEFEEESDFFTVLKNYLANLFEEVLIQVSTETNALLRSIPNTATTSVTFTAEQKLRGGTLVTEIRPTVMRRGQTVSLASGVSGGQLEAVELAVDLSIAKVIGQRTGVRPGFMIFDEAFSAHCLPVKMACLEVLQRAASDCLIIVVDHSSELKDYFTSFIDVECSNEVSRFMETK
jgi:DNA repair exonuclease SbcCD ATPase subunit